MSEIENVNGPYNVSLYINEDGHLIFEGNSEFKVIYTIDTDPTSDTYGHLLVTYSTTI